MTINDAMRALAEALEGKAVCEFSTVSRTIPTWKWFYVRRASIGAGLNHYTPVPFDFLNDEDASARLLDAMKAEEPCLLFNADLETWEFMFLRGRDFTDAPTEAMHDHRPTVIFIAALAWKGIERPEGL